LSKALCGDERGLSAEDRVEIEEIGFAEE